MVKGIIYNPNVEDPAKEQSGYMERLWEFNQLKPSEGDKKVKYMKETFAEVTIVSGVTIGEHDREYLPGRKNRRGESQINRDKFRKYKIFVK